MDTSPHRASPGSIRPSRRRGVAAVVAATALLVAHRLTPPAAAAPAHNSIGPACNVVNDPDGHLSIGNCFDSLYGCPLAFERPLGYSMLKIRLTNHGPTAARVRTWWHVVVQCEPYDVGPYDVVLPPGASDVVWHAEAVYTFNDKVRFFRWTTDSPRVTANFAGSGCAPADARGLPGRFRRHPRTECRGNFDQSATWRPAIYMPVIWQGGSSDAAGEGAGAAGRP